MVTEEKSTENPNRKETAAIDVLQKWEEFSSFMESEILATVRSAKLVNPSSVSKMAELMRGLPGSLRPICKTSAQERVEKITSGEITPEILKQEEETAEQLLQYQSRKSDVQLCVDNWLTEQLEENSIKLEVLNDEDTESFEFTVTESKNEILSGCTDFSVPDQAKAILTNIFEGDNGESFEDRLKELLTSELYDSFCVDTEYDGCGETTEMEYELS